MNANGIETILIEIGDHTNLEKVKAAICCLCCLFTFGKEYSTNVEKFSTTSSKFISHLFPEGTPSLSDSEFSKFWIHFFTIINRACVENRWDGGFSKLEFLWDENIMSKLLDHIDNLAKPYRILIYQKVLELEIFQHYEKKEEHFKNPWSELKEFSLAKLHEGRDEVRRQRSLRQGKKEIFIFMENHLNKILSFNPDEEVFKKAILTGRFDKKILGMEHTIILGEDGGWYILINSLTTEEENMVIAEVDESKTFQEYLKLKMAPHQEKQDQQKLVIGTGSFGKIRLGVALIVSERSRDGDSSLMCGEIICMKKSADSKNATRDTFNMRIAVWNDYASEIVGRNILSPEIYDMGIICSTVVDTKHNKAYAMQEFAHFTDGNAFKKNTGIQVWSHQKTYLHDIFSAVDNLMEKGIAMTDLKPQNTLYDKENRVGKLIDLAGVLRKRKFEDLQKCKLKDLNEYTAAYSAPELIEQIKNNNMEAELDLTKALAYSMGIIIKKLVIEKCYKNKIDEQTKDIPKELIKEEDKCPNIPLLFELVEGLTQKDVENRLTFKEGLLKLDSIGPDYEEKKIDFTDFIASIKTMIKKNPKSLGLKTDITKIREAFIKVKVTDSDPDISTSDDFWTEELNESLKKFLDKTYQKEPSLLLLGSAGTGKSTVLQMQYIQLIENWKPNDPIPFFMNLATNLFVQERWYMINNLIKSGNPNFKPIPFAAFTGACKTPLILLLDSFDESKQKTNLVKKFMKDLGNNQQNKAVICCRTDYLKNAKKKDIWFKAFKDSELVIRYIAPLDSTFDIMKHIETFIKIYDCKLSLKEYRTRIESSNLKEMMKTNYMVYLTLIVLPEFKSGTLITKYDIYKKYTQKIIKNETNKYLQPDIDKIKKNFKISPATAIEEFFEKVAQNLAAALHSTEKKKLEDFLNIYEFKNDSNTIFKERIVECLNLQLENIDKELPTIKFPHDMIKNFYLAETIFEESDNERINVLGERSLVNEDTLVRFVAEAIKTDLKRIDSFKRFIYQTKSLPNDEQIASSMIIAASNAITILVAANVPFVEEKLTNIKIWNANLRDGIFSGSDFTDADLSNVNMVNCKLNDTLFMRTNFKGVNFGIEPDLWLQEEITSMDLMSNDSFLVTTDKTPGFTLYDLREGKKPFKIKREIDAETCVALFSPDGLRIGSGGKDGKIRINDSQTGKKKRVFDDNSYVLTLVFSRDGSTIISGSEQGFIKVWDLDKQNRHGPVLGFKGHSDAVTCLTFVSDMEIISGSRDKTLILWALSNGKETPLQKFVGHTDVVTSVAFSLEKKDTFVSGSRDCKIILWKLTGERQVTAPFEPSHTFAVNCVRISPNGKYVLSCSADKTIKLWDQLNGKLIKTLEGHADSVITAHFSHDGKSIVSASRDRSVKFWELHPGAMVKAFNGQNHVIDAIALSKDGSMICSGSHDKTIRVFDRNYGNLLKTFEGHKKEVKSVAFSPDRKLIASASFDNMVIIWDVENGICKNLFPHKSFVNSVTFSPDGKIIASGSLDKTIKLWDVEKEKLLKTLNEPEEKQFSFVCFSPDGISLASSSEKQKCFRIWNIQSGKMEKVSCHSNDILSMAYSLDGTKFATGSADQNIILWNVKNSYSKITPLSNNTAVNCLSFSNEGKLLLSGGNDYTIKIWDIETGSMLKFLEGHNGGVTGVALTEDNQTIISCSTDKTVRIWEKSKGKSFKKSLGLEPGAGAFISMEGKEIKFINAKTGKLLNTLQGHTDVITCYCFSRKTLRQGNFIITGSADCTVKQWNSGTGKMHNTYEGTKAHKGRVNEVLYSLEEDLIFSASNDGTIKIWNTVHENCLNTIEKHQGAVLCLALSKNGKKLLSGGEDKIVRLWKLESQNLILEKEYKGAENINFSIKFVDFSDKEDLLFGCDDDHVVIWDMNSGDIFKKLGGVEGWREFKKVCNQNGFNFFNRLIISPDETSLYCARMFMKNCENLSKKNQAVLTQRYAVILKEEN